MTTAALQILGWTVWVLAVLLALFAWHVVLVTLLEARRVRFMNAASAVVLTWLASWFVIVDLEKLHLIWVLPAVFVALDVLQSGLTRAHADALRRRNHPPDRGATRQAPRRSLEGRRGRQALIRRCRIRPLALFFDRA